MISPPSSLTYSPAWLRECKGTSIAVVGADGFIGSHVVSSALAAGARVRAICAKDPWRLSALEVEPEVRPRWWEFDDLEVDAVALVAYEPPASYEPDAWLAHELEVNTAGAVEVARTDARLVFASSADVYGPWFDEPVSEEVEPQPATPYARAKLTAERQMAEVTADCALLRLATVYGPSEHARRAIPVFIAALARGEEPVVHGDGSDVRDYVYVGDVAAAVVNACCGPGSGVLNLGSGTGRSTLDVLRSVATAMGVSSEPRFEPAARVSSRLVLKSGRARSELAFAPRPDFEAALAEEAEWLVPTLSAGRTRP